MVYTRIITKTTCYALVAQLVEQVILNHRVPGSSPGGGTGLLGALNSILLNIAGVTYGSGAIPS